MPLYHSHSPVHTLALVGGDGRTPYAAARLAEGGCAVRLLGIRAAELPEGNFEGGGSVRLCGSLAKAVEGAAALVLPLPVTRDGVTVACPRDPACAVPLSEVAELCCRRPDLLLLGGRLPPELSRAAMGEAAGRVVDYYEDETLCRRNAYLTAEAALMTAMSLSEGALGGTAAAVVGYGRIGQALARLLRGIGMEVTVCARRPEALAAAAAAGCIPRRLEGAEVPLFSRGEAPPLLFNTVPAPVLGPSTLWALERGTRILDLASAPFGVETEALREATEAGQIAYLRAPSLPGSYAPRDGGAAIGDCVLRLLGTRGPRGEKGGQGI